MQLNCLRQYETRLKYEIVKQLHVIGQKIIYKKARKKCEL